MELRFFTRTPTDKNSYIILVAFVSDDAAGSWSRVLTHKGVQPHSYISRPMVAEEVEYTTKCWRMHYLKYESWEGLLRDEWMVTQDPDWIVQLIDFSKRKFIITDIIPDYHKSNADPTQNKAAH